MRGIRDAFGFVAFCVCLLFAGIFFYVWLFGGGFGTGFIFLLVAGLALWASMKFYGDEEDWRDDPATEKQKAYADDLGISYPKNITKGELSAKITEVTGR